MSPNLTSLGLVKGYVRRRVGEDLLSERVHQTVKFGGGNVMVWDCITCNV